MNQLKEWQRLLKLVMLPTSSLDWQLECNQQVSPFWSFLVVFSFLTIWAMPLVSLICQVIWLAVCSEQLYQLWECSAQESMFCQWVALGQSLIMLGVSYKCPNCQNKSEKLLIDLMLLEMLPKPMLKAILLDLLRWLVFCCLVPLLIKSICYLLFSFMQSILQFPKYSLVDC